MAVREKERLQKMLDELTLNTKGVSFDCFRKFETEITRIAKEEHSDADLKAIYDDDQLSAPVRYAALYGLVILYRHQRNYGQAFTLLEQVDNGLVSSYPSFKHLWVICSIDWLKCNEVGYEAMDIFLNIANKSISRYTKIANTSKVDNNKINLAGVNHAFAELFAACCEENCEKELIVKKWYKKALRAIEEANRLDKTYAKYYCTWARVIAQNNDYDQALKYVEKAIDMQSIGSNQTEYALRILDYQSYKIRIQAQYEIYKMKEQQDELQKEVEHMKGSLASTVEIIAFFSGVIGFIVSGISLSSGKTSPLQYGGLLVVLMGCLLVAFDSFSMMFHSGKANLPIKFAVLIIGLLIIVGGLLFVWKV